jgi:hypothetical protein
VSLNDIIGIDLWHPVNVACLEDLVAKDPTIDLSQYSMSLEDYAKLWYEKSKA